MIDTTGDDLTESTEETKGGAGLGEIDEILGESSSYSQAVLDA